MYSKKTLILCILQILKEYSDENHRLKQKDIINYLEKDYNMSCDRKTVKANIIDLIDLGYEIESEEIIRRNKNGEEEIITTDWYYVNDFDDTELKLMIDSLLFSKTLPAKQLKSLIEKIKGLANHYFSAKVKHVYNLPELQHTDNKNTMYNLDMIDEAIERNKQILFMYNTYGTDKKMHPRRERKYLVNPYQVVANNGRFYLLCNYDKYENMAYYRIDRITDMEILNDKRKPMRQVKGLENGLNLPKTMAEHIYMYADDVVSVEMKAMKFLMGEIIDWFGKDFTVISEDDEYVKIRLKCSENAMFYWAMQYGKFVEILSPESIRTTIKETITEMSKKYS